MLVSGVSLQQHVNGSGFPLQLAVASAVRSAGLGWSVLYEEHAWKLGDESGFIDMVLEDQYKTWLMNLECKRVRDSEWIFLRQTGKTPSRRHTKLWVTHRTSKIDFFDWTDVPMDPPSVESKFCVVPGQDSKARPMLERVAASLVQSTEALAREELDSIADNYSALRIYQNIIVTTAALKVCDVDVSKIDLANGEIDEASAFLDVPCVRFRKQLGSSQSIVKPSTDSHSLSERLRGRESTVFVVNAAHFIDFLDECELPENFERFCPVVA